MEYHQITQKNIAVTIILSIITCGIYALYWLYCLAEDMNQLSGDGNATSGGKVILFSIITCGIYELVWLYRQGERVDQIKTNRGQVSSNTAILYLLLGIFGLGIVSYALMQNEINNMVA